ncbi:hypothetical protein GQ44DRAFT_780865 [Phaeosphaeriaceae sp. PMI808]|nr:hypothetical protein GQ44DRAFT_780865 [Phaeosphaeriaceae sp. PMI808]
MAAAPKNWILTDSQGWEPGKDLSLGQVLWQPFDPASGLIPVREISKPPTDSIIRTNQKAVEIQSNDVRYASLKTWAGFRGFIMAQMGIHASRSGDSSARSTWTIDELEEETFIPSMQYVREVMRAGDVPLKAEWWKLRRRIFLVTGVRIGRGAKMTVDQTNSTAGALGGNVSAWDPTQSTSVSGGVEAKMSSNTSQFKSVRSMSDFVYAYRLHEINYRLWISKKSFTDGGGAAVEGGDNNGDREKEMVTEEPSGFELESIDLEPVDDEAVEVDIEEHQFVD